MQHIITDEKKRVILEKLTAKRIELNVSQNKLHRMTGIAQSNISRLENNQQVPTLDTLLKIGHALNVNILEDL